MCILFIFAPKDKAQSSNTKRLYFFEYRNTFAIVHIFKVGNIKKLNILFTYSTNKSIENELFMQITNWAINNEVDLVWMVDRNINIDNAFPKMFTKSINFASWSADKKISETLEKGLFDPQGVDSDIDSNLYVE